MQITRQADYAVRAMVYLAQLGPDKRAATLEVARRPKPAGTPIRFHRRTKSGRRESRIGRLA